MTNSHSKTYSSKSNAKRAALKAIENPVGDKPELDVDFRIEQRGEKAFVWRRISQTTEHAPQHPNTKPEKSDPPATEKVTPGEYAEPPEDASAADEEQEADEELEPVNTPKTKKQYNKGAVKQVWDICEENKDLKRKDVITICVSHGINYYTARTQYQAWKKASDNS